MAGDMARIPAIERFEMQYIPVTESGCWLWLGAPDKDGYGFIQVGKMRPKALDRGESQYVVAARFGISQCHVSDIKNGKRWSYIQRKSLE